MLRVAEHERLTHGGDQPLGHLHGGANAVEVLADHHELVAAQPGHGVGGPHRVLETRRQRREELIAGSVPERVVDELEVIEIEQDDGDCPLVAPAAGERAGEPGAPGSGWAGR